MRVINYSDARNRLKSVLDQVVEDADYTVISRRDADDAVVMAHGQPAVKGHDAIRKMLEVNANIPGFEVSWEPKEAFVSLKKLHETIFNH